MPAKKKKPQPKTKRKPDISVEDIQELFPDDIFDQLHNRTVLSLEKLEYGEAASDILKATAQEAERMADEILRTRKPVAEQAVAQYQRLRKLKNVPVDFSP